MLVKLQGKAARGSWTWVEGERDDVLATVPDDLFKVAMERVMGG